MFGSKEARTYTVDFTARETLATPPKTETFQGDITFEPDGRVYVGVDDDYYSGYSDQLAALVRERDEERAARQAAEVSAEGWEIACLAARAQRDRVADYLRNALDPSCACSRCKTARLLLAEVTP